MNIKKLRSKNDKIFDNTYNAGLIEYEQFSSVKISAEYESALLSSYYDAQDYYRNETLMSLINDLWIQTKWFKMFGQLKKVPKQYLSEIFTYFIDCILLSDTTYSNCEMFVIIADFLDVTYKSLYEMISPIFKIKILKEIDEKFNVLNTNKTISLF